MVLPVVAMQKWCAIGESVETEQNSLPLQFVLPPTKTRHDVVNANAQAGCWACHSAFGLKCVGKSRRKEW